MPTPLIRVVDLHKSFGPKDVLRGVDFEIFSGEILFIIGKSGSGKSVIFKHLTSLLHPDRGAIYFEDRNIYELNGGELDAIRAQIGVAFQMSALFDSLTIFENVAFGLKRLYGREMTPEAIAERSVEALAMVGLRGIERKSPADISGGMQKRVAIARAIAYRPRVLLYDEPTTGLDPITAGAIDELILALNSKLGITSVVVSHDMPSVFKVAQRITMLYEGRMLLTGTPANFHESEDAVVRQFVAGTRFGPIPI